MSIEYFVEGKVVTQTEGNQLNFSKGSIAHNSVVNVNQKGNTTGVSYNQADEVNPDDKPVNTIDVSLNLFFDGTQNNKTNTEAGKDHEKSNHKDDSYTNDYSNVARGFDAIDPEATNQYAIYIEGIGTEDLKSESIIFTTKPNNRGIPFGTGPRGVEAKVTKGCLQAGEKLSLYAGRDLNLIVNVYGFSRGAAAARHFVHVATNPGEKRKGFDEAFNSMINTEFEYILPPYKIKDGEKKVPRDHPLVIQHGYFGACLLFWEIIPKKIIFNFVGLYDTVASYGMNHRGGLGGLIGSDTEQLGLTSINKAYFVLQIAADDEHRDNFDLTNIDGAGVKGLQFTLPGVHSDIGGCYVSNYADNSREVVDLFRELEYTTKCEKFRDILIEEGWYLPEELQIINSTPEVKRGPNKKNLLVGTRKLYNTYDKIPLNTMFYYSSLEIFGVKYKDTAVKDHQISDPFLQTVSDLLNDYMNSCTNLRSTYVKEYNESNSSGDYIVRSKELNYSNSIDMDHLKTLRNKYLHWSASVTKFGLGPKVGEVTNGKERKRNIQNG